MPQQISTTGLRADDVLLHVAPQLPQTHHRQERLPRHGRRYQALASFALEPRPMRSVAPQSPRERLALQRLRWSL